jgi:hypothetical protein
VRLKYNWLGNSGDYSKVHNIKSKDVCSATLILLLLRKQIATNIPYGNQLKKVQTNNYSGYPQLR